MSARRQPDVWDLPKVSEAFDTLRSTPSPLVGRELEEPCRCGWRDVTPLGSPPVRVPVVDLSDADGYKALETSPTGRTCKACTHPIPPGTAAVVHRLTLPGAVLNRYHPECVEIGQRHD